MSEFLLKKKYKNSINDYLESIASNKSYKKYLSNRDSNCSLYYVKIFDVLDNEGMNKLVQSLYKLNPKNFKVKNYFSKPGLKKNNYANIIISDNSILPLAKIELKDDIYIKNIELNCIQINNQQFAICYRFVLRSVFNNIKIEKEFIKNNIKKTFKGNYQSIYATKNIATSNNFQNITNIEDVFFRDIFQSYIVNHLYTDLGINYKLPILYCIDYSKANSFEENLKSPSLLDSFYNSNENYYLLVDNSDKNCGMQMYAYSNTKSIPDINLLKCFQNFGNEYYHQMFENIECLELNSRISKYLSSKTIRVKKKDYKWLVNKITAINDFIESNNSFRTEEEWVNYNAGIKTDKKYINSPEHINKYKQIYNQYLQHINNILRL